MAVDRVVIGIDLGTTSCCVGVWRNGVVEIVPNDLEKRTTPSCVAFTDRERLIGEGAINQVATNAWNTVFDVKRLMGRFFSDASVEINAKYWAFGVIKGPDDKPLIRVSYLGEEKWFTPEEMSAMLLLKMKDTAEAYVGEKITDAVITVPAYFSCSQRQATKDAGVIAGLNVLRIINEPTAAAIAYAHNRNWTDSTVLVYDLGGGTLDVSLVAIKNGALQVKATSGDTHLGGEDFTNCMVDHFVNGFKNQNHFVTGDISGDKKALGRLRRSCEEAKRKLSTNPRIPVEVNALFEGNNLHSSITRDQFEVLNGDLFRRCMEPIGKCLKDAKMDKTEVEDVLLVGGSTRIPRVHQLVQHFFDGKELCRNINADEAVAYGATFQAAMLMHPTPPPVLDITPFSQDIGMLEGLISVVVPRNTTIPMVKDMDFTTTEDNQYITDITVYEGGERGMPLSTKKFHLSGITLAPKGFPKIKVRFLMDPHGILHVSAQDEEGEIGITCDDVGRFTNEEIQIMAEDAKRYKAMDEGHKMNVQARNDLENLLYAIRNTINEFHYEESSETPPRPQQHSAHDVKDTIKKLEETADVTTEWLKSNDHTTSDIIEKKKQIEGVYHSISTRMESAKKLFNKSFPQRVVR